MGKDVMKMDPKKARAILFQIGWGRDDTFFMSLNLTPEQADVFGDVIRRMGGDRSIEASLTRALRPWIKSHKEKQNAERTVKRSEGNSAGRTRLAAKKHHPGDG